MRKIVDEFARRPISPQLKTYYRRKRDNRCMNCGRDKFSSPYVRCAECHDIHVKRSRGERCDNRTRREECVKCGGEAKARVLGETLCGKCGIKLLKDIVFKRVYAETNDVDRAYKEARKAVKKFTQEYLG